MSQVTLDSLTYDEPIPTRSRTFTPEVVKAVLDHLTGANGNDPVKNLGIGTFDSEGQARSALVTLNKMLKDQSGDDQTYAGTVRGTEDGRFKAILINRPAKKVNRPAKAGKTK